MAFKEDGTPYTPTDLRMIQDWIIKPQLRNVLHRKRGSYMNQEQLKIMSGKKEGFIAALSQSGGSTPKALKLRNREGPSTTMTRRCLIWSLECLNYSKSPPYLRPYSVSYGNTVNGRMGNGGCGLPVGGEGNHSHSEGG